MTLIGTTGGLLGSAAGVPLSQTSGPSGEGIAREFAALERRVAADQKAEAAGGIGQTEEDEQTDERDADGRRLWERAKRAGPAPENRAASDPPLAKDASGQSGNALDLVG